MHTCSYLVLGYIFEVCICKHCEVEVMNLRVVFEANQCHSQNEQVTWPQHGHIQCMRNTHLLVEPGHGPAIKIFELYTLRSLLRLLLATNTIISVLPVCSLHDHMKAIAHANICQHFTLVFASLSLFSDNEESHIGRFS